MNFSIQVSRHTNNSSSGSLETEHYQEESRVFPRRKKSKGTDSPYLRRKIRNSGVKYMMSQNYFPHAQVIHNAKLPLDNV